MRALRRACGASSLRLAVVEGNVSVSLRLLIDVVERLYSNLVRYSMD